LTRVMCSAANLVSPYMLAGLQGCDSEIGREAGSP